MLAIVLARRDFREFDQIITLLTAEVGKVEALARGIKKPISKNSMALEPASLVEVELISGKEITHLTTGQAREIFPGIRKSLEKISGIAIILHIVGRMIKGNERDHRIFELLKNFLFFLDSSAGYSSVFVTALVLKLFSELGFTPTLDRCVSCGTRITQLVKYTFDLGNGGLVCESCLQQKNFDEHKLIGNITESVIIILKTILKSPWTELTVINRNKVASEQAAALVYNFALYHSGQKLPDWRVDWMTAR